MADEYIRRADAPCAVLLVDQAAFSTARCAGRRWMEVKTMFQVELLSGGVFTVYAVDQKENMFLIYRDGLWNWIGMEKCKPYTYPWQPLASYTTEATT